MADTIQLCLRLGLKEPAAKLAREFKASLNTELNQGCRPPGQGCVCNASALATQCPARALPPVPQLPLPMPALVQVPDRQFTLLSAQVGLEKGQSLRGMRPMKPTHCRPGWATLLLLPSGSLVAELTGACSAKEVTLPSPTQVLAAQHDWPALQALAGRAAGDRKLGLGMEHFLAAARRGAVAYLEGRWALLLVGTVTLSGALPCHSLVPLPNVNCG